MPWHTEKGGGDCGPDEWAVIADADGSTAGCHVTEAEADAQVTALYAEETVAPTEEAPVELELPATFTSDRPVVPYGAPTHESGLERIILHLGARELPLPLMLMVEDAHGGVPTMTSHLCGNVTAISSQADGLYVTGTFDLNSEWGKEAARLVSEGVMRSVSADLEGIEETLEEVPCADIGMSTLVADDTMVMPCVRYTMHDGNLIGLTLVPFPAFDGAEIVPAAQAPTPAPAPAPVIIASEGAEYLIPLTSTTLAIGTSVIANNTIAPASTTSAGSITMLGYDGPRPTPRDAAVHRAVTAAARLAAPLDPPRAWFDDPLLDEPTPITVTEDGRVFGHACCWGDCHLSFADRCVPPPRSISNYRQFRVGTTRCDDGTTVTTGVLQAAGGHAPLPLSLQQAVRHYDDTNSAVADVTCGEDSHGMWVAGALRPDAQPEQVRRLRGNPLSGDWRPVGRHLELIALSCVNTPAYPVPHTLVAAASSTVRYGESGEVEALVASFPVASDGDSHDDLDDGEALTAVAAIARVDRLEAEVRELRRLTRPQRVAALRERLVQANGG